MDKQTEVQTDKMKKQNHVLEKKNQVLEKKNQVLERKNQVLEKQNQVMEKKQHIRLFTKFRSVKRSILPNVQDNSTCLKLS